MINVPKKADLDHRSQRFEHEAQEFEKLLRQQSPEFEEHDIVIERKGNIVGLKYGRLIALQVRFGWKGKDLYWVANGLSEFDDKGAHGTSFDSRDAAIQEFKAAVPKVVTELHGRREELSFHGIA
jgi:hypothetical protein